MIPTDQDLIEQDIVAYLQQHERKDLLRFLTCGSVDDGKSTLIGRLLYDSKQIYEDQLTALHKASEKHGTTGGEVDLALLTDGLKAEREQGITIDVAYRYFSTRRRKFIIADCPGHEQYTRNMATGASGCDLAILLVDARHGVQTQTRRHAFIVSLLGIRHIVVAINKMDLVGWSQARFEEIRAEFIAFAARLDLPDVHFLPLSALKGDNVVDPSTSMPWFQGGPLLAHLESVHIANDRNLIDLRLPVQMVLRPHLNFRGFAGTVAGGVVRQGDAVVALPSGRKSTVKEVFVAGDAVPHAFAGQAAVVTLTDEIDLPRGSVIVHPGNLPHIAHDIDAMVVWMSDQPMKLGQSYLLKIGASTVPAMVTDLKYRVDVNTLHRQPTDTLGLNGIARLHLSATRPLVFDPYVRNRATGNFILIDRATNATLAAGMIIDRSAGAEALARSGAVPPEVLPENLRSRVTAEERAKTLGHGAATVWLTGLPKSGKSTIAYAVERALQDLGVTSQVLDGRGLRAGLSRDLGYGNSDRSENARRAAAVAHLLNDAGLIAITSLISPFTTDRQAAREAVGPTRFIEVYLAADVATCRTRDTEGVYATAAKHHTDIVEQFEPPPAPDLTIPATATIDDTVAAILAALRQRGAIPAG